MSTGHILLLGAIAGATIFLGLPVGRLQNLGAAARAALSRARDRHPPLPALGRAHAARSSRSRRALKARHWGRFSGSRALGVGGFALGLMALVYYAEWMKARAGRRATALVGPGAAAVDEFEQRGWLDSLTPAKRSRSSSRSGSASTTSARASRSARRRAASAISLAVMLIIGFGLHNATEGFGICGPLAGEGTRPSWGFLGCSA